MPYQFLKPNEVIRGDVTRIDLNALWAKGIRGFIFDLDNTLMAPHAGVIRADVASWLANLNSAGFKSFLLTNNKRELYSTQAAALLNMPVIWYAAKPNPTKFNEALELLQLPPSAVAVVGDRPLTDIWGGQRIGAYTILVDPLIKDEESKLIQYLRALERAFIQAPF
ncbi:MAG: YqeG family HAD IIIA-type phosphatase [Vampirovibrionales bacterium]|nr:YqeG family HAD IIIA-type phosphatase [Vampirovibrionales bacterium]